jgi:hypothetical protein
MFKILIKPERWVREEDIKSQGEDINLATACEVLRGQDEYYKKFKFAAIYQEYKTEAEAEAHQNKINAEAYTYLASTDWYVVRHLETGMNIPIDIKEKRKVAREAIVHGS